MSSLDSYVVAQSIFPSLASDEKSSPTPPLHFLPKSPTLSKKIEENMSYNKAVDYLIKASDNQRVVLEALTAHHLDQIIDKISRIGLSLSKKLNSIPYYETLNIRCLAPLTSKLNENLNKKAWRELAEKVLTKVWPYCSSSYAKETKLAKKLKDLICLSQNPSLFLAQLEVISGCTPQQDKKKVRKEGIKVLRQIHLKITVEKIRLEMLQFVKQKIRELKDNPLQIKEKNSLLPEAYHFYELYYPPITADVEKSCAQKGVQLKVVLEKVQVTISNQEVFSQNLKLSYIQSKEVQRARNCFRDLKVWIDNFS